jgi:hypothetical protein
MTDVRLPLEYHATLYHGCQVGLGAGVPQVLWRLAVRTSIGVQKRWDFWGMRRATTAGGG